MRSSNGITVFYFLAELQIRGVLRIFKDNVSNDGSQYIFYGEIWLIIPQLSLLPLHIWSSVSVVT